MDEYAWAPHIHSEVTRSWFDSDMMTLFQYNGNTFRFTGLSNDMRITVLSCSGNDGLYNVSFSIDCGYPSQNVIMEVMDTGLCHMMYGSDNDIDPKIREGITSAVFSIIFSCIGDHVNGSIDGVFQGSIDKRGIFGPVTAYDEHDAVIKIFSSVMTACQNGFYDIMNMGDDHLTLFSRIGKLIEHVSYAESFVSSVKHIVPDEYDGMMETLKRYRQCIDDRSRTIKIENDIRSEAGQRQLNRSALSINRGMYHLSVLGIAVGMFGASIVADCIGFLGTTSKAIIISATSAVVLAVCWRICSRRSDDIEDVASPSLERSL